MGLGSCASPTKQETGGAREHLLNSNTHMYMYVQTCGVGAHLHVSDVVEVEVLTENLHQSLYVHVWECIHNVCTCTCVCSAQLW